MNWRSNCLGGYIWQQMNRYIYDIGGVSCICLQPNVKSKLNGLRCWFWNFPTLQLINFTFTGNNNKIVVIRRMTSKNVPNSCLNRIIINQKRTNKCQYSLIENQTKQHIPFEIPKIKQRATLSLANNYLCFRKHIISNIIYNIYEYSVWRRSIVCVCESIQA